jgi:hypothetical protein
MLASMQRAAISSGIIINKNLKLFLINYLPRKVDVLFHFPSVTIYLGQNLWQDCVGPWFTENSSHLSTEARSSKTI